MEFIEIKLNEANQSFYKDIADISIKTINENKNNPLIIFKVLYAQSQTYYVVPFNIKYFGYHNSGWILYSCMLTMYHSYDNFVEQTDIVKNKNFYFPRDKIKILIRIPQYVHTIKNTHNAKKIIPYLPIPYDLHHLIYSYF